MSKKILEALKKIDPKELASSILKKIEEDEVRLKEFINSKRFKEIISLLKEELINKEVVTDNPYRDFVFANVSNLEYIQVFEALFNKEVSGLSVEEDLSKSFPMEFVVYEGLIFRETHGQGTSFSVRKV